jgi:ferritin
MLKTNIEKAFKDQVNKEFYSAFLYLSMASHFENTNLKGFSNWMKIQFQEEQIHAMKFFDYIIERNSKALLTTIKAPKTFWKSPIDVFEDVYNHEVQVTKSIHTLFSLCQKENDHASCNFLQWFIQEQVEEEASSLEILEKLKLIKNDGAALFILDKELKLRILAQNEQK